MKKQFTHQARNNIKMQMENQIEVTIKTKIKTQIKTEMKIKLQIGSILEFAENCMDHELPFYKTLKIEYRTKYQIK